MTASAVLLEQPPNSETREANAEPRVLTLCVRRKKKQLTVEGIVDGLPRKSLAKAIAKKRTIVFDLSRVEPGVTQRRLHNLLLKVRGMNQEKGQGEIEVVLKGLCEEVSQVYEALLRKPVRGLRVSDREFALSTRTRTVYSPSMTFTVSDWERSPLTLGRYRRLIERDGASCAWCGSELAADSKQATVDHVLPRAEGGKNTLDNYLLSCSTCNHSRSDRDAVDWLYERLVAAAQGGGAPRLEAVLAAIRRVLPERYERLSPRLAELMAALPSS